MRNIYLWCVTVIALLSLGACRQVYDEPTPQEKHEKLYVTFSIAGAEAKETRAVPNAPNGTEANGDYESSYKSVDVMFFESGGNSAVLNGKRLFHFDATGFTPPTEEKSNWVGGVYERANNQRGVYLIDVSRTQVNGKTCVVVLNLPEDVRRRVESGNISSLDGLKNAAVRYLGSADEQLGPKPYPKRADGAPDYNSSSFQHIVMIGETPNIQIPDAEFRPVVNVSVERTIAKVKIVGVFDYESGLASLASVGLRNITMRYKYYKFPSRTHLGAFWAEKSTGRALPLRPVDAADYVERRGGVYGTGNQVYFVHNFYMNEYGELPDNATEKPYINFSATIANEEGTLSRTKYWVLELPRGMQRNKSYTIYVYFKGQGSETPEGYSEETLKATKILVEPWENGVENFSPKEIYNFNDFIGNPKDKNDAI